MQRVSVREFNRKMYFYIKNLPVIVYNKKTGKNLFKVEEV